MRETHANEKLYYKNNDLERAYLINTIHVFKEKDNKTKDVSSQCDYRRDMLCTCRNVSTLRKRKKERYYDTNELNSCHARSRSYTEVGIGSVRTLLKRRVQKIYLPETIDTGCGSSDFTSVFVGKTKYHNVRSFYESKSVSSKCVGGIMENDVCGVLSEKLSPIIKKVSESTSPKQSENRNIQIGSYLITNSLVNVTTQVEEKIDEQEEVYSFQLEKKQDRRRETEYKDQTQNTNCSKHIQNTNTVIVLNCKEPQEVSSESLLQYIHDLEYASEDAKKSSENTDGYENETERSTFLQSKSKETATGDAPKTYIQPGLMESEYLHTEPKSSSDAQSYSIRASIIDSDMHNSLPTYHSSKFQKDDMFSKFDVNDKKPVFKIWSKRFEDILQATLKPSFKKTYDKKDVVPTQSKTEKVEEKEKRNFFFFKKKHRDKEKEKTIRKKKSVTTEFCEVKDGLKIAIGKNLDKEKSEPQLYDEADTFTWVKNFLSRSKDSCDSLKVRWNNRMFNSSSSMAFKLKSNFQKDTESISDSKSMMNLHSSCYQHLCSRQQDMSSIRDIQAWMIPNTIVNYANIYPTKKRKRNNENMEVRISDQKWIIDKSKAFSHKIEVILYAKNIVECNKKESCLRIDIPNGFFPDSSDTSVDYSNKRRDHSSDERVYNVVEYETGSDFGNPNKNCITGQQMLDNIEVTVSFKSKNQMQSRLLETMIKTPTVHRDVIIQGSAVCIPAIRDDIVGVSIVAENDMFTKDKLKPILTNEDLSFSSDDSDLDRPRHKTCVFGESFLREYYRNCAGLDLWCVNDCHLLCCSETSMTSGTNPGIITKSCPNILDDFLVAASCMNPNGNCNRNSSHTSSCSKRRDSLNSVSNLCNCKKKMLYSFPRKELKVSRRVLPKDSIEVYKRRKIYAMSMKSQWKCSDCDAPACSVASTQSRGTSPRCWSLKDCNDHSRLDYIKLMGDDNERNHICLLEKKKDKNKSYNMESKRKTCGSHSVQDVSTSFASTGACCDHRDFMSPTIIKKLAHSASTSPVCNSDIYLSSNCPTFPEFSLCKSSSDSNTPRMKRKSKQHGPCCKHDGTCYQSQHYGPTTPCPLCGSINRPNYKESVYASLTKVSHQPSSLTNTRCKRYLDKTCSCRPACPHKKYSKRSNHKYYPECPETPPLPLGFKSYIECPATPPSLIRFRSSTDCPPTPPSPSRLKSLSGCLATPPSPVRLTSNSQCPATPPSPVRLTSNSQCPATLPLSSMYAYYPECPSTPTSPLDSKCPLSPNRSTTFLPYLVSSQSEIQRTPPLFKSTKSCILSNGSLVLNPPLPTHHKCVVLKPRHKLPQQKFQHCPSCYKKSRKTHRFGSPLHYLTPNTEPEKYNPPCHKHHKCSSSGQSIIPAKCTSPNTAGAHKPYGSKTAMPAKCASSSQNCPHVPQCIPFPKPQKYTTSCEDQLPSKPNATLLTFTSPSQISPSNTPCPLKIFPKPQQSRSPSKICPRPTCRKSTPPSQIHPRSQPSSPKLCSRPRKVGQQLPKLLHAPLTFEYPKSEACRPPLDLCPDVPPCCCSLPSHQPRQTRTSGTPCSPETCKLQKCRSISENCSQPPSMFGTASQTLQRCTSPSQNCPHVPPCYIASSQPRKIPRVLPYNIKSSPKSQNSRASSRCPLPLPKPIPTPRICTSPSQECPHTQPPRPKIRKTTSPSQDITPIPQCPSKDFPDPKTILSKTDIRPHSPPSFSTKCTKPRRCSSPSQDCPHSPKCFPPKFPEPEKCRSPSQDCPHETPCNPEISLGTKKQISQTEIGPHSTPYFPIKCPKPEKCSSPSQDCRHDPPCFPKMCLIPEKFNLPTDMCPHSPPSRLKKSPEPQKCSSPSQKCPHSPPSFQKTCPSPKKLNSPTDISPNNQTTRFKKCPKPQKFKSPSQKCPHSPPGIPKICPSSKKCNSATDICPHSPPCFPVICPEPKKCSSPSQICSHTPPCFPVYPRKCTSPSQNCPHVPPCFSSQFLRKSSPDKSLHELSSPCYIKQDKTLLRSVSSSQINQMSPLTKSPKHKKSTRLSQDSFKPSKKRDVPKSMSSIIDSFSSHRTSPSKQRAPYPGSISATQNGSNTSLPYPRRQKSSKSTLDLNPKNVKKCTSMCRNCPHNPPCFPTTPSSPTGQRKQKSTNHKSPLCTSPTQICLHNPPCFQSERPKAQKCTSPSQDCSHTPPCFPPPSPKEKQCTSAYKICSHSPPCYPSPCRPTKCTSPSQICSHSPPCYPALGFTLQKCISPPKNCPHVPLCFPDTCPKPALPKQSSKSCLSKPSSKSQKCTSPSEVCRHSPQCFPSIYYKPRKSTSPLQICNHVPRLLSRPSLNTVGNSNSQINITKLNNAPSAQTLTSNHQGVQIRNENSNHTLPKISQETSHPPVPNPPVQQTSTPSLKSFFPFNRHRENASNRASCPSKSRSRSGLLRYKDKKPHRNKQCCSEKKPTQTTKCQCSITSSLHCGMNNPLVVEQHSIYDRHCDNSLTPSVMRLHTPCRCCTKGDASPWALKVKDSGSSSMSVYYAHSTERIKKNFDKNYNTYAKLNCHGPPKNICPNNTKTRSHESQPSEYPPYLPASHSRQTSRENNIAHTGIYLKISPLAKQLLDFSNLDETPGNFQQKRSNQNLSQNTPEKVTIELAKDVAVMREELGIKVKDVNGHTLYERKVFELAPSKPASNMLGNAYKHSEFHRGDTPVSSDKDMKNDENHTNAKALEIHFIIKVLQVDKNADYTIPSDVLYAEKMQDRPQDTLFLSDKDRCSDYKADDKEDLNIYITIKHWKAQGKAKLRKSNSVVSEISTQNLSTFNPDLYGKIETDNVNKISSELRATIDLSSSLDNSKARVEKHADVGTTYTAKSAELVSNLQDRGIKECHITKSKSRMTKLREMLKIILTSNMSKSGKTKIQTIPSNEVDQHVTFASLNPNYFRHCHGIYSNYKFERNLTLSDTQINKTVTYPVANSDVFDESDGERSILLQCRNLINGSYHELKKINVKAQKPSHLTNKATRQQNTNILQFPVDVLETFKPKIYQIHENKRRKHATKLRKSRVNQMREHHDIDNKQDSTVNVSNYANTLCHDHKHDNNAKNEIKKNEKRNIVEISDILQSYETKKAVLKIYAERDVSGDGKRMVAKLPKFEFDAENEIYNAITT